MLFNSFHFIFIFIPIVFSIYFILVILRWKTFSLLWLVIASLAFYGWDQPSRLPLLLYSIIFNYLIGFFLIKKRNIWLLIFGIFVNIIILIYFKYSDFILESIHYLFDMTYENKNLPLPIGISFFTFTQIAFLVDAWGNQVRDYNPVRYGLFVTFFPHLVAGPILHHKNIMAQFTSVNFSNLPLKNISLGLTWFGIGLFKKTFLADGIANYVGPTFSAAATGTIPGFIDAWIATLSFTLQIYYDFSGYSDMACGLAFMLGIVIPLNFNSPYKATSLIDFWRRWHISLSNFLRDYLYIPLGGNRKGVYRHYLNLLITMVLGGLWHGASWNFVIWGFIHGIGILVNHVWRSVTRFSIIKLPVSISWFITLFIIVVSWVPFRADGFSTSVLIWKGMMGFGPEPNHFALEPVIYILVLSCIAIFFPNTQQILLSSSNKFNLISWSPNLLWGIFSGFIFGLGIAAITFYPNSEFLYFRF